MRGKLKKINKKKKIREREKGFRNLEGGKMRRKEIGEREREAQVDGYVRDLVRV